MSAIFSKFPLQEEPPSQLLRLNRTCLKGFDFDIIFLEPALWYFGIFDLLIFKSVTFAQ